MPPDPQLLARFATCRRYLHAERWQKPFLDPARFLRNQARMLGWPSLPLGGLRTVRTFHVDEFTVVNGENVSEGIASYGVYEDDLTEAFIRLIEPGQVVVDIGMHLGYFTTLFARLAGERGAVHAFEPTPSTRELALRNVSRWPQVTVHPFAVWSSAGRLDFHDYGIKLMAFNSAVVARLDAAAPAPKLVQVETKTLDAFRAELGRAISLVKVDAEGAEQEILTGSRQLLAQDRPIVTLETGDGGGKVPSRELVKWMQAAGYRAWEFREGRFQPHTPRETYGYDNLIFADTARSLQ